jgi:hypothetical protein
MLLVPGPPSGFLLVNFQMVDELSADVQFAEITTRNRASIIGAISKSQSRLSATIGADISYIGNFWPCEIKEIC